MWPRLNVGPSGCYGRLPCGVVFRKSELFIAMAERCVKGGGGVVGKEVSCLG